MYKLCSSEDRPCRIYGDIESDPTMSVGGLSDAPQYPSERLILCCVLSYWAADTGYATIHAVAVGRHERDDDWPS